MLRRIKLLSAILLAVTLLAPMTYSATALGKIQLYETPFEKFGSLFYPFTFAVPQLIVLCEFGVDLRQRTGCVDNMVSDYISVTTNQAGEGVVSMISDLEVLVVPPDFPLPPPGSPITLLPETGTAQRLTPREGLATVNADGSAGPRIRLRTTSDVAVPNKGSVSDILLVSAQ